MFLVDQEHPLGQDHLVVPADQVREQSGVLLRALSEPTNENGPHVRAAIVGS